MNLRQFATIRIPIEKSKYSNAKSYTCHNNKNKGALYSTIQIKYDPKTKKIEMDTKYDSDNENYIPMETNENEEDENVNLQNSYKSLKKAQLKQESHEYREPWERSRCPRNKNVIKSIEGERIEQGKGSEYRRSKGLTKGHFDSMSYDNMYM